MWGNTTGISIVQEQVLVPCFGGRMGGTGHRIMGNLSPEFAPYVKKHHKSNEQQAHNENSLGSAALHDATKKNCCNAQNYLKL